MEIKNIAGIGLLGVGGYLAYKYFASSDDSSMSGGSGAGVLGLTKSAQDTTPATIINFEAGSSPSTKKDLAVAEQGVTSGSNGTQTLFNASGSVAQFNGDRGVVLDKATGQAIQSTTKEVFNPIGSAQAPTMSKAPQVAVKKESPVSIPSPKQVANNIINKFRRK